ncbi:MAG: glycosyltransferase [Clostridiales Family XIII bacterium]|jgi:glycosyltransferase involved in cell wall biosynthesis/acetyl esterase/lipase|nr:glycosyltransferase [Clostridiales Family XIII bacterium]
MKKLRVLMVGVHPDTKGGIWTVVDNYLHHEGYRAAVDVTYVATATGGPAAKRHLFSLGAFLRLFFILLTKKIDLVHIHSASRGSFVRKGLALRIAKRFGKPVVFHLHGAQFEAYYDAAPPREKRRIEETLARADRVLCLGSAWEKLLREKVGVAEGVEVLHNAVAVPPENPYDPGAKEIIFLGEVGRRKGAFDLIEAAAQMRRSGTLPEGVSVLLYGGGAALDEAARAAEAAGGADGSVRCMGFLAKSGKRDALRRAMLHVLPSYDEGLPMSVLETMAAGIPNVTTGVGAIPDAVEGGKNGILVRPGDPQQLAAAIGALASSERMRKEMSGRAFGTMREKFSLDGHVEKLLRIYRAAACGLALLLLLTACGPAGEYEHDTLDEIASKVIEYPEVEMKDVEERTDIFGTEKAVKAKAAFELYTEPDASVQFLKDVPYAAEEEKESSGAASADKAAEEADTRLCDIVYPLTTEGAPARNPLIVFVPGGSFTTTDKDSLRPAILTMAHHGYTAVSISTRHMTEYGYDDQLTDVLDAVQYLVDHAADYAIDPNHIILQGTSSGGNLALNAAYTRGVGFLDDDDAKRYTFTIEAVCTYSAPISPRDYLGIDPDSPEAAQNDMLKALLGSRWTTDGRGGIDRISPTRYVTESTPPTLVLGGGMDAVVPAVDGESLYRALRLAGVRTDWITYEQATHTDFSVGQMLADIDAFYWEVEDGLVGETVDQ